MKELRYKIVLYSILGIVILTFYLIVVDFIKARWERYDAGTGVYTKELIQVPDVYTFERAFIPRDTTSILLTYGWFSPHYGADSSILSTDSIFTDYYTRTVWREVYIETTKRKTRRK